MKSTRVFPVCVMACALRILVALLLVSPAWATVPEKILHNFSGASPAEGLVFDSAGNLYGTTVDGGSTLCEGGCGTVFQLSPRTGGGWNYHLLHAFAGGTDGFYPGAASSLFVDAEGDVIGVTSQGGSYGYGIVFEMTLNEDGTWTESIIHSFSGIPDGNYPTAGLVSDAHGNLYGTTIIGGVNGEGTVYELTPVSGGGWTEQVIFSFSGTDGMTPYGPVTVDGSGNLFGTTYVGGAFKAGVVFELSPGSSGSWTQSVLYSFPGTRRGHGRPETGVLLGADGNIYGTASDDGLGTYGAVFKLAPGSDGNWTESTIHTFGGTGDGIDPAFASLVQDSNGTIYGTTQFGGPNNAGTVYAMIPNSSGGWREAIVYIFDGEADGGHPVGGVILDPAGHLYGTAESGGSASDGVVFEMKP